MNIKNIVLGIAVIILTISVVVYGINTFYEKPQYEDFCEENFKSIQNQEECENQNGKWNPNGIKPVRVDDDSISGYCDLSYYCRQDYDNAREIWSKNVFLIAIPLGIVIIAIGALIFGLEVVGAGLMGGGVGTILYGVFGYWRYTENWLRFIISLLGLIALIYLSYYFNKKFKK